MNPELAGHDRERRTFLVPCRSEDHGLVGQLADHAPSRDARLVEVVDDGGPVDLVPTCKRVDRRAVSIEADQCIDLAGRQSSLDRV